MHILDWIIVLGYLIITFSIGLFRTRWMRTIQDYAVGSRDYDSFAIFATVSATIIGANTTLGLAAQTYAVGIAFLVTYFGCSFQQIITTTLIAPRIRERFGEALSIGDIMKILYGKQGQLIGGICSLAFSIGIMSAQVAGVGYVFNFFLGISHSLGCVLGCGVLILYSAFGGMKGVVNTDVFQLLVLGIAMVLVAVVGVQEIGGFEQIVQSIPDTHWDIFSVMTPVALVSLFIVRILGTMMSPPYIQRMLIARTTQDYVRGGLASSLFFIPIFGISALVGFIALGLYPNIQASIAMPHLIKNSLPPALLGVAIAGLLAVIMSTTDSWLHAATIALVHDIIQPLQKRRITASEELKLAKVATLILGFSTLGFSLTIPEIPRIMLYSFNFWTPVMVVPLLAGACGHKVSNTGFIASVVAGIVATLIWNMFWAGETQIEGLLIGVLANWMVFSAFKNRIPVEPVLDEVCMEAPVVR